MGQVGAMIADAGSVGVRYARRLLDGIPVERFARLSCPNGQTVLANHPAFNVGHLTLYPKKMVELLGGDQESAAPPPRFDSLFSKDDMCQDDPNGTIYPAKSEVLAVFHGTYDAAFSALKKCDDSLLLSPNPVDSPLQKLCPTLGSMLAFYAIGHVTMHLGQVSTWRRMEGMPAA